MSLNIYFGLALFLTALWGLAQKKSLFSIIISFEILLISSGILLTDNHNLNIANRELMIIIIMIISVLLIFLSRIMLIYLYKNRYSLNIDKLNKK